MFQSLFRPRTRVQIPNINPQELADMIAKDDDVLLLDVRTPGEYQYDGHIEGSRLLPLSVMMQRIDEIPRDRKIVCVCRSGNRSQVACEQLSAAGYTDLYNLSTGMIGWKRAGLPHQ